MIEDSELLRRFHEQGDSAALAELVQRRVGLVYGVALRSLAGDTQAAQDVAQQVFIDLARKAGGLKSRPVLAGWLCRSAHLAGFARPAAGVPSLGHHHARTTRHPAHGRHGLAAYVARPCRQSLWRAWVSQ